jgi:hypothetical protein
MSATACHLKLNRPIIGTGQLSLPAMIVLEGRSRIAPAHRLLSGTAQPALSSVSSRQIQNPSQETYPISFRAISATRFTASGYALWLLSRMMGVYLPVSRSEMTTWEPI